jgi:biotin carboxyl carrier protein
MEGRTLAIAAFNTKLDDDFNIDPRHSEAERQKIAAGMEATAARIEADMDPVAAAARMDTDEIVQLGELRGWLCALAEMAWQSIGHRRTKNPRIWSLHDLEVLAAGRRAIAGVQVERPRAVEPSEAQAPEPGALPITAPMEGSFWSRAAPGQPPFAAPGDEVEAGQTIGLVEVMKTFTPVRAPQAGRLLALAAADGEGLRPGQVVAWLRPG